MNERNSPPEWPVDKNDSQSEARGGRRSDRQVVRTRGGPNWTTLALIGGLIVVLLLVAYFATSRNPDQDKLTGNEVASGNVSAADPSKLCANNSTYDLLKRDIFRRAAQVRGSDQAVFDKLANYASLRMENPVMESQDEANKAVNCSGSLSIDLPPGLGVVGGRRTLSADVDYTIQPAADGSGNVVMLRNADPIVTPLATLTRVNEPTSGEATTNGQPNEALPAEPGMETPSQIGSPPATDQPEAQQSSGAHPSFDCSNARTKGEIAVCSDAGLAALDRNMAAQYGRAMTDASPDQAALLRRTRDRFLSYRDHCSSRSCMSDAYVGRMREIRDIMEGRWQPPR
jgi:uncharacterized protein YecT (DUF1311 family)